MMRNGGSRFVSTAKKNKNHYDEKRLANVLYLYGELKNSRKLAAAMVKARALKAVETIDDLLQIVKPFMPREREKKGLASVFQAMRIEVNHVMDALHEMLEAALKVLYTVTTRSSNAWLKTLCARDEWTARWSRTFSVGNSRPGVR